MTDNSSLFKLAIADLKNKLENDGPQKTNFFELTEDDLVDDFDLEQEDNHDVNNFNENLTKLTDHKIYNKNVSQADAEESIKKIKAIIETADLNTRSEGNKITEKTTIEDLVKFLVFSAVEDWLEKKLPVLVQKEVEKILLNKLKND